MKRTKGLLAICMICLFLVHQAFVSISAASYRDKNRLKISHAELVTNSSFTLSDIKGRSSESPAKDHLFPSMHDVGAHIDQKADQEAIINAFAKRPLSFIENRGQVSGKVKYYAKQGHITIYFTDDEVVFDFIEYKNLQKTRESEVMRIPSPPERYGRERNVERHTLRMQLKGARSNTVITGRIKQKGIVNHFIGNDPSRWRTNIATYKEIYYSDIYEGIDLRFYANGKGLEYDFIVRPGADPGNIRLAFDGEDGLKIDSAGNLNVYVAGNEVRQQKPVLFQEVDGIRRVVKGACVQKGKDTIGFQVAHYDREKPLIIDPPLIFSTYVGGASEEYGGGITAFGDVYIVGTTNSSDFPTKNASDTSFDDPTDAFVTGIDPNGNMSFSTYLGGDLGDSGSAIVYDPYIGIVITGSTFSSNFPVTQFAFQKQLSGGINAFVVLMDTSGIVRASSYLGCDYTVGTAIAHQPATKTVFVTGYIHGPNCYYFATNTGSLLAFQHLYGGGPSDAFVASFDVSSYGIVSPNYISFLGGWEEDRGTGIAVRNSNAYVTGYTYSYDFPYYAGLTKSIGGCDAFVTKVSPSGDSLVYSTFLGGSDYDRGYGIAVDSSGSAYVTGVTRSQDFPATQFAFQKTLHGSDDAFVAKLTADGKDLVYSTYLGGEGKEEAHGINVDWPDGNAYITGWTDSGNFPTTGIQVMTKPVNAFVAKLDPWSGDTLLFSMFLGGSGNDYGEAVALDRYDYKNIYVTGRTSSHDFPLIDPFQASLGGTSDLFVTKISNTMTLPDGQQVFTFPSTYKPVRCLDAISAKPLGIGPLATGGNILGMHLALEKFSEPVDIYVAIYNPLISTDIFVLHPDYSLHPPSMGLVPWKPNTNGPIDEVLCDIQTSDLLPDLGGPYTVYIAVTPAGSLSSYYLWQTSFFIGNPLL